MLIYNYESYLKQFIKDENNRILTFSFFETDHDGIFFDCPEKLILKRSHISHIMLEVTSVIYFLSDQNGM